jgi:RelB Antitoxin
MRSISKKYIVDENNNKIAVQIDIEDYKKIEKILEDYALGKYMEEAKNDKILTLAEAKKIYRKRKIK